MIARLSTVPVLCCAVMVAALLPWAGAADERDEQLAILRQAHAITGSILKGNIKTVKIKGEDRDLPVLVTGKNHFFALWTRDTMLAAPGLLALGEHEVLKGLLALLIKHERSDLKVLPRRIGPGPNYMGVLLAALGWHGKQSKEFKKVEYHSPFGSLQFDSNTLVIWVVAQYVAKTGDLGFAVSVYQTLQRSLSFYDKHLNEHGLISSPGHSDWKDMLNRAGLVTYTNALYFQALVSMAFIAERLLHQQDAQSYLQKAAAFKLAFQKHLFNAEKGWFIDSTKDDRFFSPPANAIALLFGLADDQQRQAIHAHMKATLAKHQLLPALDGTHHFRMMPLFMHAAGVGNYHDKFIWLWISAMYGEVLVREGLLDQARELGSTLAALIIRDGDVRECYREAEGKLMPVKTRFYTTEENFTMSAGRLHGFFESLLGKISAK